MRFLGRARAFRSISLILRRSSWGLSNTHQMFSSRIFLQLSVSMSLSMFSVTACLYLWNPSTHTFLSEHNQVHCQSFHCLFHRHMLELPLMPRRPHIACLPSSPSSLPSNHRSRHPVPLPCIQSYYSRYTLHSPFFSNLQTIAESRGPKATYEKGVWP